jgi:cytochrome c oxidase subunit 4
MYYLLNLGSLLFGAISWIIPAILLLRGKDPIKLRMKGVFYSYISASIAIFMQILYTKHLVDISDWSALMDTQGGVIFAVSILLIVLIILNGLLIKLSNLHPRTRDIG